MEYSLKELFGSTDRFDLSLFFQTYDYPRNGLYKCRLLYDHQTKIVEFIPYTLKPIASLRLIVDNSILYDHKYSDRSSINRILQKRDGCDDILIIKNDCVTDTSYANIIFKSGKKWYTPQTCLLRGTMRESLIHAGEISVEQIRSSDVNKFEKFKLINAMLGFASSECDISHII
jgi:4-amino-4-deoxychorismate lyase